MALDAEACGDVVKVRFEATLSCGMTFLPTEKSD